MAPARGAVLSRAPVAAASGGGSQQREGEAARAAGRSRCRASARPGRGRHQGCEGHWDAMMASHLGSFALGTVARQASGIYPHAGGTRPNIGHQFIKATLIVSIYNSKNINA